MTSLKLFWTRARGWITELRRRWRRRTMGLKIIELPKKTRLVASGCCRARDLPDIMAATIERVRETPPREGGAARDEEGAATPGEIIP